MSLYVSVSVNVYDNPNMILMELKLLSHIPSVSSQHRLILDQPPSSWPPQTDSLGSIDEKIESWVRQNFTYVYFWFWKSIYIAV